MQFKQYPLTSLVLAAAALLAGCASAPEAAPAPAQANAPQGEKGQCYYRTGSNHCYRDKPAGGN